MDIQIRRTGAAVILDLKGALRLGEPEQALRDKVQQFVDSGTAHLVINLAGVTQLDSSGIGALVRAYTTLKRTGGKCTFCAPTQKVRMLLKMVRLDTVLDLVDDEASALARL
jgi:anti-sigma B factor antagonist